MATPLSRCLEQRKGWSLIIFCARATRGLRRPSPGLLARLGVPVGGRVRKLRAVEDQSAPIPEEITSELRGIILIEDGRLMRAVKSKRSNRRWALSSALKFKELLWPA